MRGRSRFFRSLILSWGSLALIAGALLFCGSALGFSSQESPLSRPPASPVGSHQTQVQERYGQIPLHLIKNQGQVDKQVKYYEQGPGQAIYFTKKGVLFRFAKPMRAPAAPTQGKKAYGRSHRNRAGADGPSFTSVRLTPVRMRPGVEVTAVEPQRGKVNYFCGNDPRNWQTDIPTYGAVLYREAYPGIDLKFYGTGRQMEYDVIVHPGADPAKINFRYHGIKGIKITPAGDLAISLPDGGELLQKKPFIYQEVQGARQIREGRFKLAKVKETWQYGFEVGDYDRSLPLIIDPVLDYSTYLGGLGYEGGQAIAVDAYGNAYVTGYTTSKDFPCSASHLDDRTYGIVDAFITKISPTGVMVYSTYLGGWALNSADYVEGHGIAVDGDGNAYVTGFTNSTRFPKVNAFQAALQGTSDAFVSKINSAGNALVYSSYLGGIFADSGHAIAVDSGGNAYVTGESGSLDAMMNAFAAKISSTGALLYNISLGGAFDDIGHGIAVDSNGNAYVTGETKSSDFRTTPNALQTKFGGVSDAFLTVINASGTALVYSTYLGGASADKAYGVAVDSKGQAYVTGVTRSSDFPLRGAFQATKKGDSSAFVAKINSTGTDLVYSSYFGSGYDDEGYAIALDNASQAYVTGWSSRPVPGSSPEIFAADAFIAKINAAGSRLEHFSHLGGRDDDWANGIAVDQAKNIYLTGETWSSDFPSKNSVQSTLKGGTDAFVTKIILPRTNITPILVLLLGD
ncbi:MAG: SBBP repeat-containing protein [Desulfobacterales bacterium]|nr:SBBP repeat-containing protein [Pseudomonadota bacterium]MCG2771866.1 SBBP repeat-containing protein [Desulfobacterales bacterium]